MMTGGRVSRPGRFTHTWQQRVQPNSQPSAHRPWFTRDGDGVRMLPGTAGEEVWRSAQPLDVLARTFDHVAWRHDDQTYLARWRYSFPRQELEVLRAAFRRRQRSDQ